MNIIICLEMHCDSCQWVDTMCSGQRCVRVVCPFMLLYVCMHVFVHIIAHLVCPYSHFHQLYLLLISLHTFQALGSYHVTMHFPKLSYLPLWFATSNASECSFKKLFSEPTWYLALPGPPGSHLPVVPSLRNPGEEAFCWVDKPVFVSHPCDLWTTRGISIQSPLIIHNNQGSLVASTSFSHSPVPSRVLVRQWWWDGRRVKRLSQAL